MPSLLRRALVAAIPIATLVQAHAAGPADPSSPAALEQPVREFLEAFIDPRQAPERQAGFFAEGVEYYAFGPTGRREIARDIRRYATRWPVRSYRLVDIAYIRPDPPSDDLFVSYTVEFEVASATRSAHGVASYGAAIADIHSAPRITMIMEHVRKREH